MLSRLITTLDLSRVCILPPPLPQNGQSSSSCTLRKVLVLPPANALPERAIQGSARRLAARLPRHLLGPSRMEGSVFAASRYGSPGSIWPPLWRWILYAGDRRGWRHRTCRLASPYVGSAIENGETRKSHRRVDQRHEDRRGAGFHPGRLRQRHGKILLIGFDHDHTTAIGRGENGGRRWKRRTSSDHSASVGQWSGAPLQINERFPEGQDVAVVLEAPDGQIIGAPGCRRLDLIA